MSNEKNIEYRSINFDVNAKEDDKHGHIICGRAVVCDSETDLGQFREIIERDALNKTNLKDIRFLINHDVKMIPLARSRNNNENSTMQLNVVDGNLDIRVNLDIENNTNARNLYSAVERGDIDGMSFMFSINDDVWEELNSDKPLHRIRSIESIYEVSAVTFPAYEATQIEARSKMLDNIRSKSLDNEAEKKAVELERQKLLNRII